MLNVKTGIILYILILFIPQQATANIIDYDIVYVRYPAKQPNGNYVVIPQGEQPYKISPGADLMVLHPDGSESILYDCDQCSVMDPFISYDGKSVYFSLIEAPNKRSKSWLYKIYFNNPQKPIRLTFDDPTDSNKYAKNVTTDHLQESHRGIRDMAPVPLADGRILFTSNRSALSSFKPGVDSIGHGSLQQLYVMDDHNGELNSKELSNLRKLEEGSLHHVQHPFQLTDGRIIFSSWQDVAHKFNYAMTSLFTINPDGTDLKQFTEPHDHHKMLEHFVTQLSDSQVIVAQYYPSFDYGYGIIMRYPLLDDSPKYYRGNFKQKFTYGSKYNISYREFDRIGTQSLTPHTTSNDVPAPNKSGKYSMPSATKNNGLLVAYSSGYVNHFDAACNKKDPYDPSRNKCDHLKSGIYYLANAGSNSSIIKNKSDLKKRLIKIKDDPNYNEIWPRAVLPYKEIYGVNHPRNIMTITDENIAPTAIVGTSSMYNRETSPSIKNHDPFQSNKQRELHDGNWTIQGAEAGVFTNADIYAVRIIGTPAIPFTKPINKYKNKKQWHSLKKYLSDTRLENIIKRYSSSNSEKWEILGEFPLIHKQKGLKDKQGNLDTSWQAKIPAETPFLIQALDSNGMTLISELTWRALKPNEKRVDCGGCHAHSIPALDFNTTATGKGYLLYDVPGVDDFDPRIEKGTWDLTTGTIPILSDKGVSFHEKGVLDVEFRKDIYPILQKNCKQCHINERIEPLSFEGSQDDVYFTLTQNKNSQGKKYITPQISKFIRSPQARQSLLVWVAYNQRLDGRTNKTRKNDIDYPEKHPVLSLSDKEKRTLSRWVDLGSPIDFPETDGFGYSDDAQLPIINLKKPIKIKKDNVWKFVFGIHDVKTGINKKSISVSLYKHIKKDVTYSLFSSKNNNLIEVDIPSNYLMPRELISEKGAYSFLIPGRFFEFGTDYVIKISIEDLAGNKNIVTERFNINH